MNATYSPQDNKLRLYSENRLDAETFAKVKARGFKWAPKQGFFVAPMWTPGREDLLLELCGSIEDETSTAEERAAERAARFENYSEKREAEADQAAAAVRGIAENIPLGQPILVGHHSERRARKDAERIENGMRKAVNLWETAEYWQDRARGALRHAEYRERPDVRVRRIKKIEADKRKQERYLKNFGKVLAVWSRPDLDMKTALAIANVQGSYDVHESFCFPLDRYPRTEHTYEGAKSIWSALDDGIIDEKQAAALMVPSLEKAMPRFRRWIAHFENRIAYERAMLLGEGIGADAPLAPAQEWQIEPGGTVTSERRSYLEGLQLPVLRVNKKSGVISSVTVVGKYGRQIIPVEEITCYTPPTDENKAAVKKATAQPPIVNYPGEDIKPITKAEWSTHYKEIRFKRATEGHGAYRYRMVMYDNRVYQVFITDQKQVPIPPVTEQPVIKPTLAPVQAARPEPAPEPEAQPVNTDREAFKAQLKNGVQVAVADQLFPTPPDVVRQMLDLADIEKPTGGMVPFPCIYRNILEPSAGTGNILQELSNYGVDMKNVDAVELNHALAGQLRVKFPEVDVMQGDFLDLSVLKYDCILMNPPFRNGEDIKHIEHAVNLLAPGGVLVAICANGPRQNAKLKPMADEWIELPSGTFDGTGVHAAILRIEAVSHANM